MNLHPIFGAILARFQDEGDRAGGSAHSDPLNPQDSRSVPVEEIDRDAPIYGEPDDAAIDAMLSELSQRWENEEC